MITFRESSKVEKICFAHSRELFQLYNLASKVPMKTVDIRVVGAKNSIENVLSGHFKPFWAISPLEIQRSNSESSQKYRTHSALRFGIKISNETSGCQLHFGQKLRKKFSLWPFLTYSTTRNTVVRL